MLFYIFCLSYQWSRANPLLTTSVSIKACHGDFGLVNRLPELSRELSQQVNSSEERISLVSSGLHKCLDRLLIGLPATVVDKWIYIDGGEFSFTNNGNTVTTFCKLRVKRRKQACADHLCSASTVLSIDLSRDWTNATVQIHSTSKPDGCVSLNHPSFWYHAQEDVIYSGFAGWQSTFDTNQVDLNNISIWTFKPDGTGSGAWNDVLPAGSTALSSINRPEQSFQAFGDDSGWVLGGFDKYQPQQYPYLASMTQFNMSSRTFTNQTDPDYVVARGAVDNGEMHYVPSFGAKGLFVSMGGDTIQNTTGLISFDTVGVLDPVSQQWYNQTTTGSPPTARIEFCTAGIASTNNTYEM